VIYIFFIYKKRSERDLRNYRGILMTSIMTRIYGRILRDLIKKKYSNPEEEERIES